MQKLKGIEQIKDNLSIDLTIVVPAYNEEKRISPYLKSIKEYFAKSRISYEILVINDGSIDETSKTVLNLKSKIPEIRLIDYEKNQGKGYAVRTGFNNAKGQNILIADADGSTPISEIEKLLNSINNGAEIACGSRAINENEVTIEALSYRKKLGNLFNLFIRSLLQLNLYDTQCGFKIFTRDSLREIVPYMKTSGFSFDIEMLYVAKKLGISVKEVPVNWHHVSGSKVNVIKDGLKMCLNAFRIRSTYSDLKRNVQNDNVFLLKTAKSDSVLSKASTK